MTTKPPKKTQRVGRATLNGRVVGELDRLHADLRNMLEHYEVRVGSRLNEVRTRLAGDASLDQPPRPASVRTARAMLAAIKEAKVKPAKARRKDFARLEKLVRRLGDMLGD